MVMGELGSRSHGDAGQQQKCQTASSSYKPALLENGVRVMVPPHIGAGTKIVVDVYSQEYVRRAD